MRQSLILVVMFALLLFMAVPISSALYQSEQAFTSDNLIELETPDH